MVIEAGTGELDWLAELMEPPSEATVVLSDVELSVLARLCGLPLAPMLEYDPVLSLDEQSARALEAATRAALHDRGIVTSDDRDEIVASPVRALLQLVAGPMLLARVRTARAGAVIEWQYPCGEEGAVEVTELVERQWRFSALPLGDLVTRICRQTMLTARPIIAVGPVVLNASTVLELPQLFADLDDHDLVAHLTAAGNDGAAVGAFVRAFRAADVSATATILTRPEKSELVGGELAWIDAGADGIWLTPLPDAGDWDPTVDPEGPTVEMRPVTSDWIGEELRSYVPS